MNKTLTVSHERVDDIPLLLAFSEGMGLQSLLDKHFPTHGNWQGLSLGWVVVVWLSYILSQADHRLNHVQPWAEKRQETLNVGTGQSVKALDFSDDRLEAVLRYLNQDESWQQFEQELGLTNLIAWQQAAEAIIQRYRVQGLLQLNYQVNTQKRLKRPYRDRPAKIVQEFSVHLKVTVDEQLLKQKIQTFGWRIYVTNQPSEYLSLADAVRAYRQEYLMERGFHRFKGFPLSLRPMYLQRDDHITGLIRLLSIGLRLLTLLEFQVRRRLSEQHQTLAGLYAGNPKRITASPTAEQLLAAFKEITLLLINVADQTYAHLTSLSPLQQGILALLDFSVEIYTQLETDSDEPP